MSAVAIPPLYRIVRAESPTADDFTSAMMLGRLPQRRDREHPNEWVGLSMFDAIERARAMARRYPVIGGWIARVELDPQRVIALQTFGEGHYTVWGHPLAGLAAVVAVDQV